MPENDTTPAGANPQVPITNQAVSGGEGASHAYATLLAVITGLAAEHDAELPDEAPPPTASATSPAPEQPAPDGSTTWVSIGLLAGDTRTVAVRLPRDRIPAFLNAVGEATVHAGLVDVQFWLQERRSKAPHGLKQICGAVVDVDVATADVIGTVQQAGVPMPTFHFRTANGFKLAFVYQRPASQLEAEAWAKALTLAFVGGDTNSALPSQGQRLPTCLKSTEAGIVQVSYPAMASNPHPLDPSLDGLVFPERVRARLADTRLSPASRDLVEEYLAECGTPAPDSPGSRLYQSCPDATHDAPCTYVRRADSGEVSVVCLGGHGGEGSRRWTEAQLGKLAGVDVGEETEGTDIVADIPLTWATIRLIEKRLPDLTKAEMEAVQDVLLIVKAVQEAARERVPVTHLPLVVATIERRLRGTGHVGPTRLHYSEGHGALAVIDREDRVRPVIFKGDGLSPKNHLHKYLATSGWRVRATEDGYVPGPIFESASLFNMALGGHPGALAELGIPILRTFDLPVAHVTESWRVQLPHRSIHAVIPYRWKTAGVTPVDPVAFFMGLFHQRRLPLATENDVRIFLMALASPLLRHVGQGQLGIFWFHGPVGSGKDYLAEMLAKIWERVARAFRLAKFDLTLTDELELKRSFFAGIGAVYARAKEAGKRKAIADLLIRLAGTDFITARGMRRDEATIPNLFTIVADSAEDVPDRREISRRTAMIEVAHIDEKVSKGDVLREVLDNAEGLILGLVQLIESRPVEWYTSQANLGSRPLIPVALSRLLGAELPVVKGRDLDDVFDAMAEYVTRFAGDEGEKQRTQAREKDGRDAQALKHYRFSAFIETMRKQIGYAETFEAHRASSALVTWITRETNYLSVDRGREPYLPVTIGDRRYAFKIVKGRRAFVLLPESEFCAAMGCQAAAAGATPSGAQTGPAATGTDTDVSTASTAAPTTTAGTANEPMSFSDEDLSGEQP